MYYHSFNPTGLLAVTCGCNVQAHLGRSQIPFKHARTTRVKLLRAEAFTQGSFAHGKLLRRGTCTERIGFTQRSVYTEKVLHRETCYTKEPLDKGNFTPSNVLHTEAFTQSSSYTEKLLHRASSKTGSRHPNGKNTISKHLKKTKFKGKIILTNFHACRHIRNFHTAITIRFTTLSCKAQ